LASFFYSRFPLASSPRTLSYFFRMFPFHGWVCGFPLPAVLSLTIPGPFSLPPLSSLVPFPPGFLQSNFQRNPPPTRFSLRRSFFFPEFFSPLTPFFRCKNLPLFLLLEYFLPHSGCFSSSSLWTFPPLSFPCPARYRLFSLRCDFPPVRFRHPADFRVPYGCPADKQLFLLPLFFCAKNFFFCRLVSGAALKFSTSPQNAFSAKLVFVFPPQIYFGRDTSAMTPSWSPPPSVDCFFLIFFNEILPSPSCAPCAFSPFPPRKFFFLRLFLSWRFLLVFEGFSPFFPTFSLPRTRSIFFFFGPLRPFFEYFEKFKSLHLLCFSVPLLLVFAL